MLSIEKRLKKLETEVIGGNSKNKHIEIVFSHSGEGEKEEYEKGKAMILKEKYAGIDRGDILWINVRFFSAKYREVD